jgi:hypothetical protein
MSLSMRKSTGLLKATVLIIDKERKELKEINFSYILTFSIQIRKPNHFFGEYRIFLLTLRVL